MMERNNNMAKFWGLTFKSEHKSSDFLLKMGYGQPTDLPKDFVERNNRIVRRARNTCSACGSRKLRLENHSAMWGDGDLFCENGHHVRDWASG